MRQISSKAFIHPSAVIPQDSIIGDFVYIGERVKILTPALKVNDYTKIHQDTFINGKHIFSVGYNCWFGGHCVFDTIGGLTICNNVGIGAHSQVWTHMRFGDVLAGCQWDKAKECIINDDVWFVGHCIVSPIYAHPKAMAMAGSVITKEMEKNHTYGGVPAKDITDIVGPQFLPKSEEQIAKDFETLVAQFLDRENLPDKRGIQLLAEFDPVQRHYHKRHDKLQESFLQFCFPRAKFIPLT